MFSSPHNVCPRRTSFGATALAVIALGLLLFAPGIYAQSIPGYQAPEKQQTKEELPNRVKAALGEAPLNQLYDYLKAEPSKVKRLSPLEEREKQGKMPGKAVRIGVVRTLARPLDASTDGTLYNLAEGEVRVMAIVSEGALYTRVQFAQMSLPPGARVFVYSMKDNNEFYGPYEGQGLSEDGTFWTPPMKGDGVVIELFTPKGAGKTKGLPFKISEVGHVYRDPQTEDPAAGACNLEVTPEWATVAKSVGRLDFVSGGGVGLCTGTLLNDATSSQTPYLLTANHCFSTQTAAQSLRVYWNYNSGDFPPGGTPFTDGANLLATGTGSDFTFVRLTGTVPGGLYFSGWSANQTSASTPVTGIHHPDGSHKRISFGATNANCSNGLPGPCGNFTGVTWSSGTTEPGSSGSGIWTGSAADPRFVGTLTGGGASCSTPTLSDYYGRFSVTHPSISAFLSGTADCVSSISPTSGSFPASGGTGSFNVTAPAGCNWTSTSNAGFITVTSGASGSGNGSVAFSVATNTGASRSGSIVVGTRSFNITQAAGGSCAATPISVGQTVNGSLATSDCPLGDGSYYDAYSFNGTAGQTISVFMSASFDTYLILRNPDGSTLAQDDDGGGGTNSRIPSVSGQLTLPTTGTYTILANSFLANVTGPYSLTLSGSSPTLPTVSFGGSSYTVTEFSGRVNVVVTRAGSTAGDSTVNYATSDTAGLNQCSTVNGAASSRCDYTIAVGTLRFGPSESAKTLSIPIVDDAITDGTEIFTINLSNPTGAGLGSIPTATVTIFDNESGSPTSNPIDQTAFFVRQHYLDFLGREGEPAGQQGWEAILNNCPPSGIDANGNRCDRIEVSAGFFRSPEFQQRGYFIYRFYSAVGRIPVYPEFIPDFAKVSGFLSDQQLEANKVAYVAEFMARTEFQNKYSSTFSNPTAYVTALLQTVGLPNHPSRQGWINLLNANNTSETRGQVLRQLVDSADVYNKYYNEAFVIMQYFGYLRRTADASYTQWIQTMNQNPADYRIMINGFMNSIEYRQRFGP